MIFFKFLLSFFLLNLKSADYNNDLNIRILIENSQNNILIKTYGDVIVKELKTGKKFRLLPNVSYIIKTADSENIYISKEKLNSPVTLFTPEGDNYIRINSKKYKGEIKIIKKNDKLTLIEELPFEKYLLGVLAPEMGEDWPLEALKAQAVASRTYAAKQLKKNSDYDISNDVTHQVYVGLEKTNSRIIEAVNSTRGEVLSYQGKLITAFFHACCGGHTTTPDVWDQDIIKPLRGVTDPYCKDSKHYSWSLSATSKELLRFIQKQGSTALSVKNVRIYSKDHSGRAVRLLFQTEKGNFKAEAKELRKHLGIFEFKSTFLTKIEKDGDLYRFYGKGWGHGVGMCQEGAKKMAEKGLSYKKILNFYYPSSKISDIEDFIK
jgi:stage II sporulation protein D